MPTSRQHSQVLEVLALNRSMVQMLDLAACTQEVLAVLQPGLLLVCMQMQGT